MDETRTNGANVRRTVAISGSNGSSGLGLLTFSCMMASTGTDKKSKRACKT